MGYQWEFDESAMPQNDPVSDVIGAAGAKALSGYTGALGTITEAYFDPERNRRQIAMYEDVLNSGYATDGRPLTEPMRKSTQDAIRRMEDEIASWESPDSFMNRLYRQSEAYTQDVLMRTARAKEGLGPWGQTAVDIGIAGVGLGLDALGGLPAVAVRSGGSAAMRARETGATMDQRLGYAAGTGLLSAGIEQIANLASPFAKSFGKGILEKLAPNIADDTSRTAYKRLLMTMLSEGGETALEDMLQPFLGQTFLGEQASYDKDVVSDVLYNALISAILGGVGEGLDILSDNGPEYVKVLEDTARQMYRDE